MNLEAAGIPTVFVASSEFIDAADAQSHALGADPARVFVAHPIQDRTDAELVALIKKKYRIKNTVGYSVNALIDFHDPIDILIHLIVGSEGTLGFVSL